MAGAITSGRAGVHWCELDLDLGRGETEIGQVGLHLVRDAIGAAAPCLRQLLGPLPHQTRRVPDERVDLFRIAEQ